MGLRWGRRVCWTQGPFAYFAWPQWRRAGARHPGRSAFRRNALVRRSRTRAIRASIRQPHGLACGLTEAGRPAGASAKAGIKMSLTNQPSVVARGGADMVPELAHEIDLI